MTKLDELQKSKIALVIMILFSITLFLIGRYRPPQLVKHFIVTRGVVTKASYANKTGAYIEYGFLLYGIQYSGSQSLTEFQNVDNEGVLVHRIFPVVVDTSSNSYSQSKMLLDSLSFAEYHLPYPDSLNWLKQYFK